METLDTLGRWGIGHWALGMGHWAWGMGHGAWGMGHGADGRITPNS
ncbi:hypothetical protein [Nostoc sp.]